MHSPFLQCRDISINTAGTAWWRNRSKEAWSLRLVPLSSTGPESSCLFLSTWRCGHSLGVFSLFLSHHHRPFAYFLFNLLTRPWAGQEDGVGGTEMKHSKSFLVLNFNSASQALAWTGLGSEAGGRGRGGLSMLMDRFGVGYISWEGHSYASHSPTGL